ncbi:hypothetical protein LJC71_09655 [Desulfosarcina sp. OttesenSCG-928-A07]|nr:hypothetical protein [Desulfosarcina sp. OttesenSCG-928-A07]
MDLSPSSCLGRYLEIEGLLHEFYHYFNYCAAVCIPNLLRLSQGNPVTACCKDRYYQVYDLDHPSFDLLRDQRETLYGAPKDQKAASGVSLCEYHTRTGCTLLSHKSPVCLSFMCRPAIDALRTQYGIYTYDYLGFNYALEWILTGDMAEKDWLDFRESIDEMLRRVKTARA